MRIFLLLIIKTYWFLIPKSRRRKCLFKVSCSNYVYKKTKAEGLKSGLKALRFRIQNCNPNYNLIEIEGERLLLTKTNQVFKEQELSKSIFK